MVPEVPLVTQFPDKAPIAADTLVSELIGSLLA
jgi:hypothetical protein